MRMTESGRVCVRARLCNFVIQIWVLQCMVVRGVRGRSIMTYVVGDDLEKAGHTYGWDIPPTLADGTSYSYDNWAGQHTFFGGDILVFHSNFQLHDITKISYPSTGWDFCIFSDAVVLPSTGDYANVTLEPYPDAPVYYYFTSTEKTDCARGMLFRVDVYPVPVKEPSSSPAPSPPPQSLSPPPPPPQSSSVSPPGLDTPPPQSLSPPPPLVTSPPRPLSPPGGLEPPPLVTPPPQPLSPPDPQTPPPPFVTPASQPPPPSNIFHVGDEQGWDLKVDYAAWAARRRFFVGDVLVFRFSDPVQSVLEVTQRGYQACNTSLPLRSFTQSIARVPLTAPGMSYFISGVENNCEAGMKLALSVESTTPLFPPAPASPPGGRPPLSAGKIAGILASLIGLPVACLGGFKCFGRFRLLGIREQSCSIWFCLVNFDKTRGGNEKRGLRKMGGLRRKEGGDKGGDEKGGDEKGGDEKGGDEKGGDEKGGDENGGGENGGGENGEGENGEGANGEGENGGDEQERVEIEFR